MEKAKSDSSYNKEKVRLLGEEVSKTLNFAADSFSVLRAVGLEDPMRHETAAAQSVRLIKKMNNLKEEYKAFYALQKSSLEKQLEALTNKSNGDSEDSLGFLDSTDMNESLFGPKIPEEKKPSVTRIMEKMAYLWEQKQSNRSRLFERWRVIRLSEKIKLLKNNNRAYLILQKLCRKRLNHFFDIKQASNGPTGFRTTTTTRRRTTTTSRLTGHTGQELLFESMSPFTMNEAQKGLMTSKKIYESVVSKPATRMLGNMMTDGSGNFITSDGIRLKSNGDGEIVAPDGTTVRLFDVRSSLDIKEEDEFIDQQTSMLLDQGTEVKYDGRLYLSNGKGDFIDMETGAKKQIPGTALNFFFGEFDEGMIVPKGLQVDQNGTTLISDGNGGYKDRKGKQIHLSQGQLIKINRQAHENYLKSLDESQEKRRKEAEQGINEGWMLTPGVPIQLNGITLVSNGLGDFIGPNGVIARVHEVVNEWLNLRKTSNNLKKGRSIQFNGQKIISDGKGKFLNSKRVSINLSDEANAFLNLAYKSLIRGTTVQCGDMKLKYNGVGGFKDILGKSMNLPEPVLGQLLTGEDIKPNTVPYFGSEIRFNGKRLIADGYGGFVDEWFNSMHYDPQTIAMLNRNCFIKTCIYQFEDDIDIPDEDYKLKFNGEDYLSDGQGGWLREDGTPANFGIGLASWLNGRATMTVDQQLLTGAAPNIKKGDILVYDGISYISDGKGGFVDEDGNPIELPPDFVLPSLSGNFTSYNTSQVNGSGSEELVMELQIEIESLRMKLKSAMDSLDRKDDVIEDKARLVKERDSQIKRKNKEIKDLDNRIQTLMQQSPKKSPRYVSKSYSSPFKNSPGSTGSRGISADELAQKNTVLKREIKNVQSQLKIMTDRNNETNERYQLQTSELKSTLRDKEFMIKDLKASMKNLESDLDKYRRESDKLSSSIFKLKETNESRKSKGDAIQNELKDYRERLRIATKEVENLNKELSKEKRSQNETEREIENLKGQVRDMKNEQRKLKDNYSSLKSTKDQLLDKIKGKELDWKRMEGDYKKRIKDLANQHKEALEEKFKMEKDHLRQMTEAEYENKKRINDLQNKFNQFRDSKASEIKNFFSKFDQNMRKERTSSSKRMNDRKKAKERRDTQIEKAMSTLSKRLVGERGSPSKSGGDGQGGQLLSDFQNELNDMVEFRVSNAKDDIRDEYEDRIEQLTNDNIDLQNELNMMNRENSDLQEMVQSLKQQLETENDGQEGRLRDMISELESVKYPVGSVRNSMNLRKSNPNFGEAVLAASRGINPNYSQVRKSFDRSPELNQSITSSFDPLSGPKMSKSPPRMRGAFHSRSLMPQGTSNYGYGTLLTNLRKARLMNSALKKIVRGNKHRAFMSIFAANVKDSRAIREAGLRLKGRLLIMMKARYGDCQLRRRFLRWSVIINKTLLRDCITKIAIYSRINHQSAFWRFRTLIQRNVKVKLPENAKRARIMTASLILERMAERKLTEAKVVGWNGLKPLHVSERLKKLIHCIKSKVVRNKLTMSEVLRRLRSRNRKAKSTLNRIVKSYGQKRKESFNVLNRNMKYESELERKKEIVKLGCISAQILLNKNQQQVEKALGINKFLKSTKIIGFTNQRLSSSYGGKLSQAFRNLVGNCKKLKEEEKRRSRLTKMLITRLGDSFKSKQDRSLKNMTVTSKIQKAQEELRNSRKKNLLSNLLRCHKGKLGQCLDHMYRNNLKMKNSEALDYSDREKQNYMKRRLVKRLVNALKNKVRNGMDNLKDHNAELKAKELADLRKRLRILNYLISGSRGKIYKAMDRLKENAIELSNDDKLKNALDKIAEEKKKKAANVLLEALKRGLRGKQVESLDNLVQCNEAYNQIQRIRDLEKEKDDKLKTKLLRDLIKSQLAKKYQAFIKTKIFSQKVQNQVQLNNHQATYIFKTNKKKKDRMTRELLKSLLTKQRKVFDILRAHRRLMDEEEAKRQTEEALRNKLKEQMIKGLFTSQNLALAQAYYRLKDNSETMRAKYEKESSIKNSLLKKLLSAFLTKQRESLSIMTANNKMMKLGNERKIKLRFRLINGLVSALTSKFRESYEKLYNNAEILKGVNLLERERRRRILSRMFDMRNNKKQQDTTACYNIMKVFAMRNKHKEEMARRLINSLFNGQRAKLEAAISNLRTHNLAAWNEDRLNQTLIDIQMDKELRLKHKLFKNIMKAHASKAMSCLRKMKYHVKYQREQEEKCKEKLNFFVMNAKNKAKNDAYKAYRLMVEFAKSQKQFEYKIKVMSSKINNWMSQAIKDDIAECFRRAREFNEISKLNEKIGNRVKRRLVAMISAANSKKLFDAFTRLRTNKNQLQAKDKERSKYGKYIVAFMGKGNRLKAHDAYRIMINFAKKSRVAEQNFERATNKLGLSLNRGSKYKLMQALNKLRQHKDNESKGEDMKKRASRLLINRLRFSTESSLESALRRLIDHCNKSRDEAKDRENRMRKLAIKLIQAQNSKTGDGFKNLFKNFQDLKDIEDEEASKKAMILRKLENSMQAKLAQALNELERFADNSKMKEAEINKLRTKMTTENIKSRLFRNLFNNQKQKFYNAFDRLMKHKKNAEDRKKMEDQLRRKMIRMLIKSQNGALGNAYGKLKTNADNMKTREAMSQRLLERLFNKLQKNQHLNQRAAYDRLKQNKDDFDSIEQRHYNIIKRLGRKLGNSQKSKLGKALEILIRHNDDNKKIQDRQDALRRRLVRGLVKNLSSKLQEGYRNLLNNKDRLRDREGRQNTLKRSFLSKLISKNGMKLNDALDRLRENAQNVARRQERRERLMKKLVSRLNNAQKSKLGGALDNLRRNNEIQGNASMRDRQKIKTMILLMARAQGGKTSEALKKMRVNRKFENDKLKTLQRMLNKISKALNKDGLSTIKDMRKFNSDYNDYRSKAQNYIEWFFKKKRQSDKINKLQCYKTMVNHAMKTKSKKQREMMIKRRIINMIASKQSSKVEDSLRRLQDWTNDSIRSDRKRRVALNIILRGLTRASNSKVNQAFRRCYENYVKLKDADTLNRTVVEGRQFLIAKLRKKLFKNFFNAMRQKKNDAVKRLVQHRQDCIREDEIKAKLARKLVRTQQEKLGNAINQARMFAKMRTKAFKKIIDSLSKGQSQKCRSTLSELLSFAKEERVSENQRTKLLNRLFNRISNNAYSNVSEAFQRLYGKKLAMRQQQRSILPTLLHNLYKNRLQQAQEKIKMRSLRRKFELYFSGLLRWKLSNTEAKLYSEKIRYGQLNLGVANLLNSVDEIFNKRKANAFSNIKSHHFLKPLEKLLIRTTEAYKKTRKDCLNKLVQNALYQRTQDQKIKSFFQRLREASCRKEAKTVNNLRMNNMSKGYREKIARLRLAKILTESTNRQKSEAMRRMVSNKNRISTFCKVIAVANSKTEQRSTEYYLRKWVNIRGYMKTGEAMQVVSNMFKVINDNHRTTIKSAFKKWSEGNMRTKCEVLSQLIQKLRAKKQQHAYDSIVYNYEMLKRDQIRRGIVSLMTKVQIMKERRLMWGFNSMRIENENKWIRRVVNIWTLETHVDYQISFWRLRYKKNISAAKVSPQQSLKLKALVNILNKKIFKNLSKAFWRIDQGRNTPDDMNVSFAVMPLRGSSRFGNSDSKK